jgi:hypothetical protein
VAKLMVILPMRLTKDLRGFPKLCMNIYRLLGFAPKIEFTAGEYAGFSCPHTSPNRGFFAALAAKMAYQPLMSPQIGTKTRICCRASSSSLMFHNIFLLPCVAMQYGGDLGSCRAAFRVKQSAGLG